MGFLTGAQGIITYSDDSKISFCSKTTSLYKVSDGTYSIVGKSFFTGSTSDYSYSDISTDAVFDLGTTAYTDTTNIDDNSLVLPFIKFAEATQKVAILDVIVDSGNGTCRVVYAYSGMISPTVYLYTSAVTTTTGAYGIKIYDNSGKLSFNSNASRLVKVGTFTGDFNNVPSPVVNSGARAVDAVGCTAYTTKTSGIAFDYTKHAVFMPIGPYKGNTGSVTITSDPQCGSELWGTIKKYRKQKTTTRFWSTSRATIGVNDGLLSIGYINANGGRVSGTVYGNCVHGGAWGNIENALNGLIDVVNDILFNDNSFSIANMLGYVASPNIVRSPFIANTGNMVLNGIIIDI